MIAVNLVDVMNEKRENGYFVLRPIGVHI